jgi:BirA family biotin operon repressor/biotin-[acetyl-CoA-carboxylase] ligase
VSATLIRLQETRSTQDEAHRLAELGAPGGTAVVAARQAAGRGARGRAWQSPEGGLWLSVLWRPRPGDDARLLSLRAGLALATVLDGLGGLPPVALKWPNDLMMAGRKVGGVLCEARWQGDTLAWVVLGVGLNVRNLAPEGTRLPAASLVEWRDDLVPGALAAPVAAALARLGGAAALAEDELAAWHERDWLLGRRLAAPVAGVARGLTATGELVLETADGARHLSAADASALEPA